MPNLKSNRIPAEFRGEMFKERAIQAARDVFGPLFNTLNAQQATPAVRKAKFFLQTAYENYEAVICETYDRTLSPGEAHLETSQRYS